MKTSISINTSIDKPDACYDMELDYIYAVIQVGTIGNKDLRKPTQSIQAEKDHEIQNKLKREFLPPVTFCGTFTYRKADCLKEYSSYLAIDYDNIPSDNMELMFERLKSYPFVDFLFHSPSGHGIKAIVVHDSTDPAFHGELFEQVCKALPAPYLDKSGKDLARATYLCWDPDAWKNESPTPFHFEPALQLSPFPQPTPQPSSMSLSQLRTVLAGKEVVKVKSDKSMMNMIDAYEGRNNPDRFTPGHRANSLFKEATNFCNNGVDIDLALEFLNKKFGVGGAGLDYNEVEYQTVQAYTKNLQSYGKNRSKWG